MTTQTTSVPLCLPEIDESDVARVAEVTAAGWLIHGPYNAQLEEEFAEYLGVGHALSLNSCASALHLALLAQGIEGEVIVPSFTFMATANAVVTAGATPVYADIQRDTCNLDPAAVEAAVTPRTEAIMPVHYAGLACEMDEIMRIAERHGLAVVEDSAENVGGEYRGRKAGSFGTGCFSFYPTKNMTTAEGGMLTTDDESLAARARTYAGHGVASTTLAREKEEKPWLRAATLPGYNFRMSNIHAAIGVGQLARLDDMNARRRAHADGYGEALGGLEQIELPVEAEGCSHVYQMYTPKLAPGLDRTAFLADLRSRGVGASVHFDPPVHRQPYYAELLGGQLPDLPVTDEVAATIFSLPMFPAMTPEQRDHVAESVTEALAAASRP